MENKVKKSQMLYIIEAALEYFVAILVSGSFLATLTGALGLSDGLTGILSSIISLGCLFQLLSMFVRRKRMKRFVVILSILNQLLFMLLYVVPIFDFGKTAKTVLFIVFILAAYLLYYIAHPKKISWLMGLVSDSERGRFTANKEIVSLISGILFSYAMGSLLDHYTEKGDIRTAMIIGAVTIFVLTVFHTLTMLFTVEKVEEDAACDQKPLSLKQSFSSLMKNKSMMSVIVIFILYYISTYVATPFYGTYQLKDLNIGLSTIVLLSMLGSISRILVSRFWGRYADRNSFSAMVEKCLLIMGLSYVFVIFAVPKTGMVMFALYYIVHGIAMGGVNSALINLVFDYVPHESRADSLAICQAIAGVVGFVTTLAVSPLVSLIQKNHNEVFGIPMYAQQLMSLVSAVILLVAAVYVRFAILKKAKSQNQ